jgi:hypothetical protein
VVDVASYLGAAAAGGIIGNRADAAVIGTVKAVRRLRWKRASAVRTSPRTQVKWFTPSAERERRRRRWWNQAAAARTFRVVRARWQRRCAQTGGHATGLHEDEAILMARAAIALHGFESPLLVSATRKNVYWAVCLEVRDGKDGRRRRVVVTVPGGDPAEARILIVAVQ